MCYWRPETIATSCTAMAFLRPLPAVRFSMPAWYLQSPEVWHFRSTSSLATVKHEWICPQTMWASSPKPYTLNLWHLLRCLRSSDAVRGTSRRSSAPKRVCTDTDTQTHRQTQTHRDTETQRHRDTETQRHRDTETQRHRDTETQRHRDTETQRHRDTETQRHRDTQTHTHTHTLGALIFY